MTDMTQAPDLVRAEARMPRWMIGTALIGASSALAAGFPRVALGFSVGALFGILNFLWLHQTVVALMDAQKARVPVIVAVKMMARYPLCWMVMFWFYKSNWAPVLAVVSGLLVPGAGALIESLCLIVTGWRRDEIAE